MVEEFKKTPSSIICPALHPLTLADAFCSVFKPIAATISKSTIPMRVYVGFKDCALGIERRAIRVYSTVIFFVRWAFLPCIVMSMVACHTPADRSEVGMSKPLQVEVLD